MIISYMRSSSFLNYDFCPQQYYLTYVLGTPRSSAKKADKGTIVHKVMEVLANCKKVMQDYKDSQYIIVSEYDPYWVYEDSQLGEFTWTDDDFLKPTLLTSSEIDDINKTRINKYNYKHDAKLKYGTIRYGADLVNSIIERAYNYYAGDDWAPVDKKDCTNWAWMALEYKDGICDPRRRTIVAAEPHFEFEIDKPWAKYAWNLPNGEKISGNLAIKGTIDLITQVGDGILEIVDFKSGRRINWSSKKDDDIKTYAKLCDDFQLMLYHYAAKRLYPEAKQIIVSIFFIRDGGLFTICMDDTTIEQTEERIKKRFFEIVKCQQPAMLDVTQRHFKCTKLCDYYKMQSPDGSTNMCKFIHDQIVDVGIDEVTNLYTQEGFSIGQYQAPGEKE